MSNLDRQVRLKHYYTLNFTSLDAQVSRSRFPSCCRRNYCLEGAFCVEMLKFFDVRASVRPFPFPSRHALATNLSLNSI